jgi:hypothetical protein
MPKKLFLFSALLLLLPVFALAAYNDVTLTNSVVLTVGGHNLNVYGSNAVLQSITVNSSDFSAVLSPGSEITVMSSERISLPMSSTQAVKSGFYCEAADSLLSVSYGDTTGDTTVTVTPSSTVCGGTTGTTASTGSNGPVVGGGGGGAYTPITTPTPAIVPTAPASGLSSTQVDAIISLLTSFGADQSIIDNVRISLAGAAAATNAGVSGGGYTFTQDLKLGSRGEYVRNLQKILNSDPETRIASTGSGSPGNETNYFGAMTMKAVQKFQLKYKIAAPGNAGYGKVGPMTRAKLNELTK